MLDQRRALIGGAFFGTDVLAKAQLEGAADEFATPTLQMLIQHGEIEPSTPAIIRLMQQLGGFDAPDFHNDDDYDEL